MKIHIQGYTTLNGRPLAIVQMIRDAQLFQDTVPEDMDEFIRGLQESICRTFGITIQRKGATLEEKAENLLREMAANNIIRILEED